MAAESGSYVIGVDVGTAQARAAVFDLRGHLVAVASHPVEISRPDALRVEQSSRDIWGAVCHAVRECLSAGRVDPAAVAGIGFDATCSLVVLDDHDQPLAVSPGADPDHNVIVWMDHRATTEAEAINVTRHRVLEYVGGRISPEMQSPKLRWLKTHAPDTWARARRFFDLADYLVYEACRVDVRSLCTVVCKWTYLGHEGGQGRWDESFFAALDLSDLFSPSRVGERVQPLGTRAGGLTAAAARDLGLRENTTVAVGIIDAHAGGIGSLGMTADGASLSEAQLERTLALIGGTSSCHMATSPTPRFVEGVWGPYYGAMIPGRWLTEGGQSATGALVDHVIENHAYARSLERQAAAGGITVYELLNRKVAELAKTSGTELTADLHVLPYFHGNRSPRADPHARGTISGLSLDSSFESLARLYLATIQAIAYGTRHIIAALNASGYQIDRIHACGGGTRNALWMQQHADVTGCEIYVAQDSEPVLLGASILAAVASGRHQSIVEAMGAMSPRPQAIRPRPPDASFHARKYEVFKLMYEEQRGYRRIMTEGGA